MLTVNSTPSFTEFDPTIIRYQGEVINDIFFGFDYSQGIHEILLSGSVGSAKSVLMAHIAVRHCVKNKGARILLGRKAMPDLKATIYNKILEHLEGDFEEGYDYHPNDTNASIYFRNGSEIISRSWSDKAYKKIRSLELSAAIIEELTENNKEDKQAYDEIKMRIGRLPHISKCFMISATNPDSPGHWAYNYFEMGDSAKTPTKHVYYSVTTDNPFLPKQYIEQLKNDLDPKLARRMIYGEWIEIADEVVYHQYDKTVNFRDLDYLIDRHLPIHISFDFNIGEGKPLSCCLFQFDPKSDSFHFFNEIVIEGMRTEGACEELAGKGLLDYDVHYIVNGDATGRARDTRNIKSDYEIIRNYLSNYKTSQGRQIRFEIDVPLSNPAVRYRHNTLNCYFKNELGKHRIFVYKPCKVLDQGFRLTQLKKGGNYIEDDSKNYQHVTTAAGYGIISTLKAIKKPIQGTRVL